MKTLFWAALFAVVILFAGVGPNEANARPQITSAAPDGPRLDPSLLNGLCSDVRTRNRPRYERKVFMAAGVHPDDGIAFMAGGGHPNPDREREIRASVSALFAAHMPVCDGFNLSGGNILKYSVAARAYDFIYAAAILWDVDLNGVDDHDGRTVLDYVLYEMDRNVGRPAWAELDGYRSMLVRAGARTTAQLEAGEDCRPSTRCRQ